MGESFLHRQVVVHIEPLDYTCPFVGPEMGGLHLKSAALAFANVDIVDKDL
jgi:hypothetical protein